jgi:aldose 1-epimerase
MPPRYECVASDWQGEPAVLLRDAEAGSEALVAPGCGANCVSLSIHHGGRRLAVLETPPTPDDLKTRRFRGGIPVLFPFPGRVRDAAYTFAGRRHQLPRTDRGGVHHIHGVVVAAPWRVAGSEAADSAAATLAVGPDDLDPAMRAGYPFDFAATLRFSLSGQALTILFTLENQGDGPLPFGYGLHPYFRAPLAEAGRPLPDATLRYDAPVLVPAATRWPQADGMPIGPAQPLAPEDDYRRWRPLGDAHRDQTMGAISHEAGWSIAAYRDLQSGLEVRVRADDQFREWVLYTQPNRPSLCIEPYSCVPNAINAADEGIPDAGLRVLGPGEQWQATVVIEVGMSR